MINKIKRGGAFVSFAFFLLYALLLEIYSNLMVKGNCKRVVQGYIILN